MIPMAGFFITGPLGSGKTLCAVGKIRDYLEEGRRIATNLDLNLDKMGLSDRSKASVIRLPDKPRRADLELIGYGCPPEEENEDRYGLLVLDEMATWLNSREWRDKERADLLGWFVHARKMHWHVFWLVQDADSLDGQILGLAEFKVSCWRLDRLPIPFVSSLLKIGGIDRIFPKVHVANVRLGVKGSGVGVDRWIYRGRDLYQAYDTKQKFTDQVEVLNGEPVDMRATYSVLPPYYTKCIALIEKLQDQLAELTGKPKPTRTAPGRADWRRFVGRYGATAVLALGLLGASFYGMHAGKANTSPAAQSAQSAPVQSPETKPASVLVPVPKSEKPQEKPIEAEAPINPVWDMLQHADLKLSALSYTNDWQIISLRITASKQDITRVIGRDEILMNGISIILSNAGVELLHQGKKLVVVKG
jgi:hypothetical protein